MNGESTGKCYTDTCLRYTERSIIGATRFLKFHYGSTNQYHIYLLYGNDINYIMYKCKRNKTGLLRSCLLNYMSLHLAVARYHKHRIFHYRNYLNLYLWVIVAKWAINEQIEGSTPLDDPLWDTITISLRTFFCPRWIWRKLQTRAFSR